MCPKTRKSLELAAQLVNKVNNVGLCKERLCGGIVMKGRCVACGRSQAPSTAAVQLLKQLQQLQAWQSKLQDCVEEECAQQHATNMLEAEAKAAAMAEELIREEEEEANNTKGKQKNKQKVKGKGSNSPAKGAYSSTLRESVLISAHQCSSVLISAHQCSSVLACCLLFDASFIDRRGQ